MLSYLWGGSGSKPKNENADPEIALQDDLTAHGDFRCNLDGTIEYDEYLILRSIIFRQTDRKFKPRKLELKKKQYQIYLAKDQQAYDAAF